MLKVHQGLGLLQREYLNVFNKISKEYGIFGDNVDHALNDLINSDKSLSNLRYMDNTDMPGRLKATLRHGRLVGSVVSDVINSLNDKDNESTRLFGSFVNRVGNGVNDDLIKSLVNNGIQRNNTRTNLVLLPMVQKLFNGVSVYTK